MWGLMRDAASLIFSNVSILRWLKRRRREMFKASCMKLP
jgi:hypothetical protein